MAGLPDESGPGRPGKRWHPGTDMRLLARIGKFALSLAFARAKFLLGIAFVNTARATDPQLKFFRF